MVLLRRQFWLLLLLLAALLLPGAASAQENSCPFGSLEVPLPGFEGLTICQMLEMQCGLGPWLRVLANLLTAVVVGTGLLAVVAGGYVYMTAGGSGARINLAKKIIGGALLGIILALTGYLILRTVSPQFVEFPGFDCSESATPSPSPNPTGGFIPASPVISPVTTPFATTIRLSVTPNIIVDAIPPAAQSPTGPVHLNLGEIRPIIIEALQPNGDWRPIFPVTSVSYQSFDPGILEIVEYLPNAGRESIGQGFLAKSVGTTSLTIQYAGQTLTVDVHVRPGCYGTTAGDWVPVTTAQESLPQLCTANGFSPQALCLRECFNKPNYLGTGIQGADALLEHITEGGDIRPGEVDLIGDCVGYDIVRIDASIKAQEVFCLDE